MDGPVKVEMLQYMLILLLNLPPYLTGIGIRYIRILLDLCNCSGDESADKQKKDSCWQKKFEGCGFHGAGKLSVLLVLVMEETNSTVLLLNEFGRHMVQFLADE